MQTRQTTLGALQNRLLLALALVVSLALLGPAASAAAPAPSVLTFKTVKVGAPGNPSVGNRSLHRRRLLLLRRSRTGRKTASLPAGRHGRLPLRHRLSSRSRSRSTSLSSTPPTPRVATSTSSTAPPRAPRNGPSTDRSIPPRTPLRATTTRLPRREWADKPYGFANFLRSARFANSLYNGRVLSKQASTAGSFQYVTYRVRLSRQTEVGMYDMSKRAMTRSHKSRLRHSQPERVDQGRLLRPQRWRHVLLLAVPDQPRQVRRRRGRRSATKPRSTPRPAMSPTPRPSRWRSSTLPKRRRRRAGARPPSAPKPARP